MMIGFGFQHFFVHHLFWLLGPFTMLFHQQQARQSALSNATTAGSSSAAGTCAWQPSPPPPLPLAAGETRAHIHGL